MGSKFYACNDQHGCIVSFRNTFPVKSCKYFYEVDIFTGGHMRFGWTTQEVRLTSKNSIGEDEHSICIEVADSIAVCHANEYTVSKERLLKAKNVVGCLIDVDSKLFEFYLNGTKIECPENFKFSKQPYFASGSLSFDQKCHFNFGPNSFRYPPNSIQNCRSCLFNTQEIEFFIKADKTNQNHYWFTHALVQNQVELFFHDEVQTECDRLIKQHRDDINHSKTVKFHHFDSIECLRYIQAVIVVMKSKLNDHWFIWEKLNKELKKDADYCNYFYAKLFEFIYPYIHLRVDIENAITCHNVCLVSMAVLLTVGNQLPANFPYKMFNFLLENNFVSIKAFFRNTQLMLDALICFDQVYFDEHNRNSLRADAKIRSTLEWCTILFGQVDSVTKLYDPNYNFSKLNVGFCCWWFMQNALTPHRTHFELPNSELILNPRDTSNMLKLSKDLYLARNDSQEWQSVRAICSHPDVNYFEVILLTNGPMRIGWATKRTDLMDTKIGGDQHSIAYNGNCGHVQHNDQVQPVEQNVFQWKASDVIGCFINTRNKEKPFEFYQNGEKIVYQGQIPFCSDPYFPAVSLSTHQQCYFNLGQFKSFKYPPENISYKLITLNAHPDNKIHSKSQTYNELTKDSYEIVSVFEDDQVELFFFDAKQKEINKLVTEIEENIFNGTFVGNLNQNGKKFHTVTSPKSQNAEFFPNNLLSKKMYKIKEKDRIRFIQSIIEVMGKHEKYIGKIDVFAYMIAEFIRFFTEKDSCFPYLVSKMLYPFFSLVANPQTMHKHRNVCIVLSSILKVIENIADLTKLYQQLKSYLIGIIEHCQQYNEKWTVMFAFTCLEHLYVAMKNETKNELKKELKGKIGNFVKSECNSSLNVESGDNYLRGLLKQTQFCSQQFWHEVIETTTTDTTNDLAVLHMVDKTPCLKLSPDNLTVRSYFNGQSLRSAFSTTSANDQQLFYEVKLSTSGPMRIGWASTDNNYNEAYLETLGNDAESIGIDGYNKCVWHDKRRYPFKNIQIQWKAGDIIGCLMDAKNRKFSFYINGTLVSYPHKEWPISIRLTTYNAAISLEDHQQCSCNFGQENFKSRPDDCLSFLQEIERRENEIRVRLRDSSVAPQNVTNNFNMEACIAALNSIISTEDCNLQKNTNKK